MKTRICLREHFQWRQRRGPRPARRERRQGAMGQVGRGMGQGAWFWLLLAGVLVAAVWLACGA
jgi:hypothetical protein